MTLPDTLILPSNLHNIKTEDTAELSRYVNDLVKETEKMYFDIAQRTNGHIKSSVEQVGQNWTPTVEGGTVAGSITHTRQDGYILLRNNEIDIWFRIAWTGIGTATGHLVIPLPYTLRSDMQYSGTCASTITLAGGRDDINCVSSTSGIKFIASGSGLTITTVSIAANNEVRGYLRCFIESDR